MLATTLRLLTVIMLIAGFTGCKSPINTYRMDVEQGNQITKSMVNQLRPGMTKQEVKKIMGTTMLKANSANRWDYYYYLIPGNNRPKIKKHITVFFKNNKLSHLEGQI